MGPWWLPERRGQLEIYEKDGRYFGRVIAYEIPGKLDEKNPDPALRTRPLVGIDMFESFRFNESNGRWEGGTIYDFSSGRTFACILWFEDGDNRTLWARGYVGFSLFGRTEKFARVNLRIEHDDR